MISTTLGDYPLIIINETDKYQPEPFSYVIKIVEKEKSYTFEAICNDIPCSLCIIQNTCKNGKYKTKALKTYFDEKFPEYFI